MTNAEKREIELQREAYIEGLLRWVPDEFTQDNAQDLALRRYPDPKEPTIVTAEDGSSFRYADDGKLQVQWTHGSVWHKYEYEDRFTPSFILALAEIARESIDQSPSLSSDTGV